MLQPREIVVIDASAPPPYGTIEVHHVHHHSVRTRNSACCRAILITFLLLLIMAGFSIVCFVAWNFYNLSECEKNRLPWEKPCRDWLGKDSIH